MSWHLVLGFEIHIELSTASKMFCGCPADHFGKPANTQTCPVCLGLPGALPVPNAKAIQWCIQLGLALGCKINLTSKFDRKNYFYPDIPKGYQISQYDLPFCYSGNLLGHAITRVHMEEDTGKLIHQGDSTLIDFNRSSVPLVEVVTEPDFSDLDDAINFLKELQAIVRTLNISSADMEKGSMRLEANISLSPEGSNNLPKYKIEVKNVNSFRFIKKAIEFEIIRQSQLLDSGVTPAQETRGFSESKGETVSQRSKEDAHDYRYFPEPDIPPIVFKQSQIDIWRKDLPELPASKREYLISLSVPLTSAATIVSSPQRFSKFNEFYQTSGDAIKSAKIVVNTPEELLNSLIYKPDILETNEDLIKTTVQKVIIANPKAVADIKSGKTQVLGYVLGLVKRELGNNVNVDQVTQTIQKLITDDNTS